jgi:hypothetical protein
MASMKWPPRRNQTNTLAYGASAMETLTTMIEVATVEAAEQADLQAIVELSAHDLSLVGGGTANVAFL